mgnify:CR=1 FL=1
MGQGNNQEAFFALLRAGLWPESEKQVSVDGDVEWEQIYRLASEQSVLGLVLAGIDCLPVDQRPPKVMLLQWIGEIQILEQQNKWMNVFVGELVSGMRNEGIYTLLVKGQGIAQCYEKPLWRSCGDVDFFLSDENYEKAKAYLSPLATDVNKEYVREMHLGMIIDSQVVELHGRLYSGISSRIDRELDDVYEDTFIGGNVRIWVNGETQVFLLGVENDVFYVFTHILQHFYKEGVGLRQFCDLCRLLWTFREKLDVKKLETRLKRAKLTMAWKAFAAFAVEYLGMPVDAMPLFDENDSFDKLSINKNKKLYRKAELIKDFVLDVGNFGYNRDSSYFAKYPYVIRKACSLGRRCGDIIRHARIFPADAMRFFPRIVINGVQSAVRGE